MIGTSSSVRLLLLSAVSGALLLGCSGGAGGEATASNATAPLPAGDAGATPSETKPEISPGVSDGAGIRATSIAKVTVSDVRIVPVNEAIPKENASVPRFQVLWTWKNDGADPIGTLHGDVRAYDKDGKPTYEATNALLFAKYDDPKEAVAPGATMAMEKGTGHSMTGLKAGDPVRAEVTITSAGPITKLP